jgi:dihydrofolate reductase
MIGAFVAISANGVIGVNGGLPWHYSEDLKRFKKTTMGASIIMGRKTWDSLPKRPLAGRRNIVISRSKVEGVEHYDTIEDAIAVSPEPIWIIGGAEIYQLAMPFCDTLDITRVPDIVDDPNAVRFPQLEGDWELRESHINEIDSRLCHELMVRPSRVKSTT